MPSENPIVLLVGNDPDLLFLRSAVLTSSGIWSLRVPSSDQAVEILLKVPCDLVLICYTLDDESQQELLSFLLRTRSGIKVLSLVPGDDCSGTGFLMKVEDALEEQSRSSHQLGRFELAEAVG